MILVAIVALLLWMGLLAREVHRENDYHFHVSVITVNDRPGIAWDDKAVPPFWPRYWRRLLGRPWRGQPVCGTAEGHYAESCSFAHPEMVPPMPPGGRLREPPEVMETYYRMQTDWENRQSFGKRTDGKSN
jgi:hypothetical protein